MTHQSADHVGHLGCNSLHTPVVIEWQFPVDFSQSTIFGRSGSNACTFIALCFGNVYNYFCLQPPVNAFLLDNWQLALKNSILKGNEIHDDLFEGGAVNVSVQEAVEVAGGECSVNKIEHQYDIFGTQCTQQMSTALNLACTSGHRCHVIVTGGRSMLFIVNTDGSCMIVDSHQHRHSGAVISYAPPGHANYQALWLSRMYFSTWATEISSASVISVSYL